MSLNKTRRYSRHTYGDNGALGHKNILSVSFVATDLGRPSAAGAASVHAAITGGASAVTAVTTGITQPDVPRNLYITPGGTTTDVKGMDITVTGTNVEGKTITETFTFSANATAATVGAKAFKTVTSISIPAQDGAGATFAIGRGAKIGIGMRNIASMPIEVMTNTAGVEAIEAAGASALSATVVESNTVTTTTALDGAVGFRVYVLNYKWAINPTNSTPDYGV